MSINRSKLVDLQRRVMDIEAEIKTVLMSDGLPANGKITIDFIQHVVANAFNQPKSIMTDKARTEDKAWPRMIAMALSRELTGEPLMQIGKRFARDHSTVSVAVKVVGNRCDTSQDTAAMVNELREFLKQGRRATNNNEGIVKGNRPNVSSI